MSDEVRCEVVEGLIFEHLRGDLSDLRKTAVEEHLSRCGSCEALRVKLEEMVSLGRQAPAELWAEIDQEEAYAAIVAGILEEGAGEGAAMMEARLEEGFQLAQEAGGEEFGEFDEEALFGRIAEAVASGEQGGQEPAVEPWRPWRWVQAGVVAAAGVAVAFFWATWEPPPAEEPTGEEPVAIQIEETPQEEVPPPEAPPEPEVASLPPLEEAISEGDRLRLFASEGARYQIDREEVPSEVQLDAGTVLVEYFPGGAQEEFAVAAAGSRVIVEGTVFAVTVEDRDLGVKVFEGAVRIIEAGGDHHYLEAGQSYWRGRRELLDEASVRAVESYVDLEAHRRTLEALEEARSAPPEVEPVVNVVVDEEGEEAPEERSPRRLRELALQALHDGDPPRAVGLLEQALAKTAPTEQVHGDVLLELARIHLHVLNEPQEGVKHLNQFVARWPDDPAADAIRLQFCGTREIGIDEEHCR